MSSKKLPASIKQSEKCGEEKFKFTFSLKYFCKSQWPLAIFYFYAKSWRDGKMDWTFMSFQKCSDWKTSGIFEGFIGNFKTLSRRISSSRRIHISSYHVQIFVWGVFKTMIFPFFLITRHQLFTRDRTVPIQVGFCPDLCSTSIQI